MQWIEAPRNCSSNSTNSATTTTNTARTEHYRLLPWMQAAFVESNPAPVKAALAMMGRARNVLRLPLVPLSDVTFADELPSDVDLCLALGGGCEFAIHSQRTVAALESWPGHGVPANPAAWLMTTAKRRAIDHIRRAETLRRERGLTSSGDYQFSFFDLNRLLLQSGLAIGLGRLAAVAYEGGERPVIGA